MQNPFIPSQTKTVQPDPVEKSLRNIAQYILAVVFGLLPIFFVPVAFVSFSYAKVLFVLIGILLAVIFFSLSVLRSGTLSLTAPTALWGLWGVAAAGFISAILSGDMSDALVGNVLGVHTGLFLVLLAVLATVTIVIGQSHKSLARLYQLFIFSAVMLLSFHLIRFLVGADSLTFGIFGSNTSSLIGGWNDLGLMLGLFVLLGMLALEQLPVTRWGSVVTTGIVTLSLGVLAVVNFSAIWVVLGLVSLVVMMYALTKDRFAGDATTSISIYSIVASVLVFVTSLIFFVGGSQMGSVVSNAVGVSYVEVRPSVEATFDIAREVYRDNAFVGVGPNRFIDAWRMYKDPSINTTVFWNTNFTAGSGYIPNLFITTGIFGVIAWLVFLALLVWAGFRMLFATATNDPFWYFIGSSSFVGAVYLWGMAFVYVPGPTIILLAAVFTSLFFLAYNELVKPKTLRLSVAQNKRAGIVLVGVVMVVIVASASTLYFAGRHFSSVYAFNAAVGSVTAGVALEDVESRIASAYGIAANDAFARQLAQYQIAKMNTLLTVAEPTPEQQQQFQQSAANGLNAAQLAINADPTDPINHAVQGTIYSVLVSTGVEGAQERALQAFAVAKQLEPSNPSYWLLEAQVYSRAGELEPARESALQAIRLKGNYTDALSFLAQLDIAAGNVEQALETTAAMVVLDPGNPARVYQLGILHTSAGNTTEAIAAFERAIALDNDYANARYFLALTYIDAGRVADAIAQLEVVRDLNEANAAVSDLIAQLQAGNVPDTGLGSGVETVNEPAGVSQDGDAVTGVEDTDSPLISPVNVVPEASTETVDPDPVIAEPEPVTAEDDTTETASE